MEPKRVENLHTEGTHEGILRAHTRDEGRGTRDEGEENTLWRSVFFTYTQYRIQADSPS